MKSIFLASAAFCVLSVFVKVANCKSLGSIETKTIISNTDRHNVVRKVPSTNDLFLVSDKVFRTKRDIVNNIGCPYNMTRVALTCVPIRNIRHGRHHRRKHGHQNKKV